MADPIATYSICACDLEAGQWGVATQSKFLAVGSVVPWAEPQIGAIATQAYANPRYGPQGLALLRDGLSAAEAVERLTSADEDRAHRQLGVVDAEGGSATYTGDECHAWAGGRAGDRLCGAGEHPRVGRDGRRTRRDVRGICREAPRGATDRLPRRGGGRGRRQPRAPVGSASRRRARRWVREPLRRPRRPTDRRPPRPARGAQAHLPHARRAVRHDPTRRVAPVDDALRAELDDLLQRVGYPDLASWAGAENLEERVDGEDAVDPVVLDRLRESA